MTGLFTADGFSLSGVADAVLLEFHTNARTAGKYNFEMSAEHSSFCKECWQKKA